MTEEVIRTRIKKFLIEHGCKKERINRYLWFVAPNGHKFSVDSRGGDLLIINHKDTTGKNRDFQEPITVKNVEVIAKGFILWMLSED